MGEINPKPPTLWTKIIERTNHALRCGALVSIATETGYLEERGIRFIVRILTHLERKANGVRQSTSPEGSFDPFLPYDKDLFVATLSDSHVCLLNKFNVMDHHLLIVTRAFEEQEALLYRQDFDAVRACMVELDGLTLLQRGKGRRCKPAAQASAIRPIAARAARAARAYRAFARARPLSGDLGGSARLRVQARVGALGCRWPEIEGAGSRYTACDLSFPAGGGRDSDAHGRQTVGPLQSADHPPLDAVGAAFARVL